TRIVPVPALSRTRAIASRRRPVPISVPVGTAGAVVVGAGAGASTILLLGSCEVARVRLLGRVRMRRTVVDFQFPKLLPAERAVRHHALHRLADDPVRMMVQDIAHDPLAQAPGIPGVPLIQLVVDLIAGD